MKRLIDVADLEKFIRVHRCVIGDDNLLLVAADDGRWREALQFIKTAYDVDKVVEQLEDYGNEEMEYYRNTPYEKCIEECVHKAIKVVKAGGNIELPEHSKSQSD